MAKEYEEFKTQGFCKVKNLLDREVIESVLHSFQKTVNDQLIILSSDQITTNDLFYALRQLHALDIERYKKVITSLWRKEIVFRLMHHENIVNFLKTKFGWRDLFLPGGQVVLVMAHELKIPGGYFGFIPHQDFPSVQGSLDGVVVWLPLVDVDKKNFPLEVIPGSHKMGLAPTISQGESTWEVDASCYNESDFIPVEVNVGDVVLMSMFTIHRTSLNGTPGKMRLAASTRIDNGDERTYIDRAYPTAYLRIVHREQYIEHFPTKEQVLSAFNL